MTGAGNGVTPNVRVLVPVPHELVAESLTELVPATVGVPEIKPLVVLTLSPVGRLLAP